MATNDNLYNPRPVPPDFSAEFLDEELKAISNAMGETLALELRTRHVEPIRPREGMIVYADGTTWNPGDGEGPYVYMNGLWEPLANVATATSLANLAATSGTQVNFSSINQNYTDMVFEGFSLSHNDAGNQNIQVRFSTDNGATFETGTSAILANVTTGSTHPMFGATFANARLVYFQMRVPRYSAAAVRNVIWETMQTDGAAAGIAGQGVLTLPANNIDYVRFQWSAGSFDHPNGLIRLRGLK